MAVSVAGPLPQTLAMLLEEFFRQHVDQKLAPKTVERYHEQAACLDRDLLNMPIAEIMPLHLSREWNRLLESGGHHRRTKAPRPLSAKTVRNIAGVVSSAFARAVNIWFNNCSSCPSSGSGVDDLNLAHSRRRLERHSNSDRQEGRPCSSSDRALESRY